MAYVTLDVLATDKAGDIIDSLEVTADDQGADGFQFVNDGATILKVVDDATSGDGDGITFEAIYDRFARPEEDLTRTVILKKSYIYGPFLPEIWNIGGMVRFKFVTSKDINTDVLAIRVANPT